MPIFRSQHQAELLAHLYLHPDDEYSLSQLAEVAGVPLSTAHREMARLGDAGLVASRSIGRTRLHRAGTEHPAAGALTEMLTVTFGPAAVVAEEFAELADVELVLIFGSWAARHAGHEGAPPADIDVLVVGAPRRADVYAAADRSADRLHLPVNPVLRTSEQWRTGGDALVAQVRSSDQVVVLDRSVRAPSSVRGHRPADGASAR